MAPDPSRHAEDRPAKAKAKAKGDDDASVGTLANEFKDLVLAYAKQETLGPLKNLVNYLKWGLAGTVCMIFGVVLLIVAAIRAAQTESGHHLTGSLTWMPYVAGLLVALVVIVLCIRSIVRRPR